MLTLLASLGLAASQAAATPDRVARNRCASADGPIEQPCTLSVRFSGRAIAALMGASDQLWWLLEDRLTVIARPAEGMPPILCCAIQMPLEPIPGTEFAGIVVRVPRIREALLDVDHIPSRRPPMPVAIGGPEAVPAPPRVETLAGRIDRLTIFSAALDEERIISVYTPPDIAPGERLPIIYVADGLSYHSHVVEAAARDRRSGRVILVGLPYARGEIPNCPWSRCDRRALEYLINIAGPGPETHFDRHMRFVTDELIPFVESRYSASRRREDRISAGSSNGAAWALAAAGLRPDLFGGVIAMSSGSNGVAEAGARLRSVRVFAGAGLFEPDFHRATARTVETARAAGGEARFRSIVSGHSPHMWEVLFAEGLAWLVPPAARAGGD